MAEINSQLVTSLWGNPNVDFLVGSAVGASSGTLLVWDSLIFTKVDQLVGSHFIGVIGKWHGVNETIALINIYGPQGSRHKKELWSELQNIMNSIEEMLRPSTSSLLAGVFMTFPWGRRFTRINREGTKLSKFDRFLVCNQFFNIWRDAKAKALVQVVFDHCPIVLFDVSVDFGPKSFKLFNHWMENVSFNKVVENSWKSGDSTGSSCDIVLNNKIKKLKVDIKTWWHGFSAENESKKKEILSRLVDWDVKVESGSLTSFDRLKRDEDLADLQFIEQKERDSLNKKKLARGCNASFIVLIPKVPDPLDLSDYRTISLIGCMYKGRQILDGSLVANEIVNFAKKEGIDLLLFKVDFEKAFDSVNWNFLMDTMAQMNFGPKWYRWILSCLSSASVYVLINGPPSREFKMERGLRQGDPLSLFFSYSGRSITGMKINLAKICIFGIGIPMADVANIARAINYSYGSLPFNYLGLPVGKRMNRVDAWNEVISKVHGSDGGFEAVFGSRQKGGV
ncbi:RNA-directed DNA polymerase, eukaryota, reverse transcriptase zinc-binding domain protein [Tanacetum coccineum]|uniref:RNA-directed DNA polymerase, eukaryota, reverse transcriptase zinc-binding domain protein n=1 Tax=Tanacetum coccineum TaxID=301880 RepID=A0ABQ4ZMS7_9ASTR